MISSIWQNIAAVFPPIVYGSFLYTALQSNSTLPINIDLQMWIITIVGAAMGLIKVGMWVKEWANGPKDNIGDKVSMLLTTQTDAINRINDAITHIVEAQHMIVQLQNKALENHIKLLELVNAAKIISSNQKDFIELIAVKGIADIKNELRLMQREGK